MYPWTWLSTPARATCGTRRDRRRSRPNRVSLERLEDRCVLDTGIAPQVTGVLWRASEVLPHETWSGNSVILKGVVKDDTAGVLHYTWDFGDGSPAATGNITTAAGRYAVEATHAYTAPVGTIFTARLTVTDADGHSGSDTYFVQVKEPTLDVKVDVAIDDALWYLHKAMTRDTVAGQPRGYLSEGGYTVALTSNAVLALELNGHLATGDPNIDPYAETVERGLNHLFNSTTVVNIGAQTHGNPDTNANGIGISVSSGQPPYEIGPAMMAIAASGKPDMLTEIGPTGVIGRTYRDVLTDMVDMVAWGQTDTGFYRGGWRYNWNYGASDNSVTQWPVLGLEAAESNWGIQAPAFVKSELELWLDASRAPNGSWGYTGPNNGETNFAHAGAGIAGLNYIGEPSSDARIQGALTFMNDNWTNLNLWYGADNWKGKYDMYAVMKGMRTANPAELTAIGAHDWYSEFATYLVDTQVANGSWPQTSIFTSGPVMDSAWALLTLVPSVITQPPVAVLEITPEAAQPGQVFTLDAGASYHLDASRQIVRYDFDFGDGQTYSEYVSGDTMYAPDGAFDGKTTHQYPDTREEIEALPGQQKTYYVSVTVTDDNPVQPVSDTISKSALIISLANHPPVADAGGPYQGYVGVPLAISGAGSFDPDAAPPHEDSIQSWEWELDGSAPPNFAEATGEEVSWTWSAPGTYTVGLRVTDEVGHTAIDFTTVQIAQGTPTVTTVQAGIVGQYSDWMDLQANLKDATTEAALAGKELTFYVDANDDGTFSNTEKVGAATTDGSGWATLPYETWLKPGTYNIKATFEGTWPYFGSEADGQIQVLHEQTVLTYTGETSGQTGSPATVKAVLTDDDGHPIEGRTVQFSITACQPGSAVTGPDGVGATTILLQNVGPATVLSQFLGDDFYGLSVASAPFEVLGEQPQEGIILKMDDPTTPGLDVLIVDNAPAGTPVAALGGALTTHADEAAMAGWVLFTKPVGAFTVNVTTIVSKPIVPDRLVFNTMLLSQTGGTLDIEVTDTGYIPMVTGPATFLSPIGGIGSGALTFKEIVSPINAPFGTPYCPTPGVQGPFGGGLATVSAFSEMRSLDVNLEQGVPFSLTKQFTVMLARPGYIGFGAYGIMTPSFAKEQVFAELSVPGGGLLPTDDRTFRLDRRSSAFAELGLLLRSESGPVSAQQPARREARDQVFVAIAEERVRPGEHLGKNGNQVSKLRERLTTPRSALSDDADTTFDLQ